MHNIEKNLKHIRELIEGSINKFAREQDSVTLLAVSKRKSVAEIKAAWDVGQKHFGENYLQEAQQKILELADLDIIWHFIGAIQSNKTRPIAELFSWVHCVDRLKIAKRLSEQRPESMSPLNLCLQVKLDDEASKAGISLQQLPELARQVNALDNIRLRGLMTIPAQGKDFERQRLAFRQMSVAIKALQQDGIDCDTLSMGMSADMHAAIAEGSTLVRIGTAIFGERT